MKLVRHAVAALAAAVFTVASAQERCGNVGAPGVAVSEAGKPCTTSQVVQDGTMHEGSMGEGSGSGEPTAPGDLRATSRNVGYDASGNVPPGYYVSDPNESQFLLDTWTAGG